MWDRHLSQKFHGLVELFLSVKHRIIRSPATGQQIDESNLISNIINRSDAKRWIFFYYIKFYAVKDFLKKTFHFHFLVICGIQLLTPNNLGET